MLIQRQISHDEAKEVAQRFINSFFGHGNGAKVSIPVEPNDDDLILSSYIEQQRTRK